jgi:hypothetical protein
MKLKGFRALGFKVYGPRMWDCGFKTLIYDFLVPDSGFWV